LTALPDWRNPINMLPNIAELSFKEAMRELESIVRDLETGKAKLVRA
jgi:exonuclease VII small subunit